MYDSRKTFFNVLLDNILNILNLAVVAVLVFLVLNKSFLYIIPLAIHLIVSVFNFVVYFKRYILVVRKYQRIHVRKDNGDHEKSINSVKIGDHVVLYPGDMVPFVCKVVSGKMIVDESSINGSTKAISKFTGDSVLKGTVIIEGEVVAEVREIETRRARKIQIQKTVLEKRMTLFNTIFAGLTAIILIAAYILEITTDLDVFNNTLNSIILGLPCLANIVINIYLYVLSKIGVEGIDLHNPTFLNELQDVDMVCIDKSGVLTTGQYEIFKTVIISPAAFYTISLDGDRAFEQTVSNILKTTRETGGYYSTLQDYFIYDVTKTIEDSSPISRNGLYSAITIRGGKTYALGDPENFDLANKESASNSINEYRSMGYHVLLLVESKNPLNQGLIDGKPIGIALIVLQETIRKSAIDLIEYCRLNNKKLKVISGDNMSSVLDICRKAGLEDFDKALSVGKLPFEKMALQVEEIVVFTDASASHKEHIIRTLKDDGHKVLYIGDGDNDCQAMKTANVAFSTPNASYSARKCSHATINDNFNSFEKLIAFAKQTKAKLNSVLSFLYAQSAFAVIFAITFLIAKLFNHDIYNPFEINHMVLWIIMGAIVPSLLILCEPYNNKVVPKNFYRYFVADTLLFVIPVGVIYIFQLIQYNGAGYLAIPSDINDLHVKLITSQVANSLSYLILLVSSAVCVYSKFIAFNRYKTIAFSAFVGVLAIYAVLLAFNVDSIGTFTLIPTDILVPANYFVAMIVAGFASAVYLFVLNLFEIIKGENPNVKN